MSQTISIDVERKIYELSVEDILTVIEENGNKIKIRQEDIPFIEERVGEMIDWREVIEFALFELEQFKKKKKSKAK